jgi:TatD DNase family protein
VTVELVDIGVNLAHRSFREDRDAVIERALAAGVRTLVITGTDLGASAEAAALAAARPEALFATAGVHPHHARACDERTLPELRRLAQAAVAIGECGLDFDRDFSPRPVQERWFEAQLALAAELGKPLFLHERAAHRRFVELVAPLRGKVTGVVHCFTGTAEEARTYLELGLHLGITGWICDERRGLHLREVIRAVPLERLLLETDAPFLTPRDLRPQPARGRNEPSLLPHVLRTVAASLSRPAEEVAAATTRNARRLFGLEGRAA